MDNNPEVLLNDNCSWNGLNIEVQLVKSASEQEKAGIEKAIAEWADKGIEEGYGDGHVHYYDDEFQWSKDNNCVLVWVNMGAADESALDALSKKCLPFRL